MDRIGVRELRQNASRYLARVKQGQTIEVSERGTLIALLVPPTHAQHARARLIAEGRLLPATNPTGRLRFPHAVRTSAGEASNQELLDADRDDRL